MKKFLTLFFLFCIANCCFAKSVLVTQKKSEPYFGNISQACERKMAYGNIEVVNCLKYFDVKKNGKVIASFDPINIDRNSLYIWVELSPNGKMILFSSSDQGTFVCNLKGDVLYRLGNDVNATNWRNNRYLIGMEDKDNGVEFIKSSLVLVDIKTCERIPIETEEDIALYPCVKKTCVEYFTVDNVKHSIKIKLKK